MRPTTLHAPKQFSSFSLQTSVDFNSASPNVVALTGNDRIKSITDEKQTFAQTTVPFIKVHQVSIGMTEGEAL